VRFHSGTSEILGILVLLASEELAPGQSTVAQIRVDHPVALVKNDRFVIRSYSPVRTVGGGRILNPIPVKHKRFQPDVVQGLKGLIDRPADKIIDYHIGESGYHGLRFSDLKLMVDIPDKSLETHLGNLLSRRLILQVDKENRVYIHADTAERIKQEMVDYLDSYHKAHPLKPGMLKEELKSKFPGLAGGKLFTLMLNQQIKEGTITAEEKKVRLAGHKVTLAVDQTAFRKKILDTYAAAGLQPPYFKDLVKTLGVDPDIARDVLMLLVEDGKMVKIKEELYFHGDAVQALRQRLIDHLDAHGEISTPQFKEMTSASRKYVIPLIEYFDAINVTIRIGDIRKLRKR
jgi:selenocysteine-specific elongation factor